MRNWTEKLYERSPVVVQNAMLSFYGWRLARLRYGGAFPQYLEELERSQRYSAAELEALQDENLRRLIAHCYENVPYYAWQLRELRLTPQDFRSRADLAKLPLLRKETVREQAGQFLAANYLRQPHEVVSTSGTTGKTLRIRVDREGRRRNYAFFARLKRWAGVDWNCRTATFAGRTVVPAGQRRPPYWRHNRGAHTLLFSSYHLGQHTAAAYLDRLQSWQPELIDSYPSSVDLLARFGEEQALAAPRPRAIITSSETLFADQRARVERFFGSRIFDQYGSAEQVCFISQCEQGNYHVHPEYGITEFLPDPEHPGSSCRIVATGFTNWAMPLLRYETGDLAVPSTEACACGRQFQVVEQLLGRADDLLITPDGRRIGRLDPVFKGLETIRRAQILQESLQSVRVLVVPGKGFTAADADSVRHELSKRLGQEMEIQIETVDDIPVGAGGKFRAVVCKVRGEETARLPVEPS